MEFVVSPIQQSGLGHFSPSNSSGGRALAIDANLRPAEFKRTITDAVTQSSTMVNEVDPEAEAHQKQETTIFMDDSPGTDLEPSTFTSDILLDSYKADASIANFLSRPTVIYNTTWTTGAGIDVNVPVWLNFFDTTIMKNKLANYAYIRCDLKIKILINASPFYYGLAAAIYTPLPNTLSAPIAGTTTDLIPLSQRPLVWLYPQESRGGVITAPFYYPQTWLELKNAVNFTNMGSLNLKTYVDLANANSVAGTDCDIIVYAWAENVYLCAPTYDAVMQSSSSKNGRKVSELPTNISMGGPQCDNTGSNNPAGKKASSKAALTNANTGGSVSTPLRNLASYADTAANGLDAVGQSGVGAIARGISATAKAGASVAQSFGHTDSPLISNVAGFKSLPFHAFASSEISEPRDKLSFDPKCSLTKACEAADIVTRSDTTIASLAARESYLHQFTWQATDTYNSLLWAVANSPNLMNVEGAGASAIYNMTPAAWLTRPFKYWRGDICYRFRFICTQYHRGRIRITWDPTDDLDLIPDTSSSNYNRIVDISEDVDVVVKVPYLKSTAMMEVSKINAPRFGTAGSANSATTDNGQLSLRVLTQQTSPVVSADITVVVSCWVENLIVSNPTNIPHFQHYAVQSLSKYQEGKPAMPLFDGTVTSSDFFQEYAGENVTDILQVMRRKNLHRYDYFTPSTTDAEVEIGMLFRRVPIYNGFDPNGVDVANEQVGVGTAPYNFCSNNALNWFRIAFISMRGSINWTFNISGGHYVEYTQLQRYTFAITSARETASNTLTTDSANQKKGKFFFVNTASGTSGLSLTNTRTQTSLSVAAPMFSRYKWQLNAPAWATLGDSFEDSESDNLFWSAMTYPATGLNPGDLQLISYVSAGEDFSLQFFLNVPTLYHDINPDGAP